MKNIHSVGGSIDIYKCFDQIIRVLVYVVLLLSGFPVKILTAYINYQEQANIYFSFAGHIGSPHKHRCGIPQGCPFSMMIIALLLRPWHLLIRAARVIPRSLADDLLILASGPFVLHTFEKAVKISCKFLQDIGARIA
eukprot:5364129-Karenia_brevis.AAC.1